MKALFKRQRRPGDIVFAWAMLALSVFLLSQLSAQTAVSNGARWPAQPRFWPAISLGGMVLFAALQLIGSALSDRIPGRWSEVWHWLRALEYAGWFIAYAALVPLAGYLVTTLIFALALTLRAGYRSARMLAALLAAAIVIVLLFRTGLRVNLPGGQLYEALPDGLRQFMLTYF